MTLEMELRRQRREGFAEGYKIGLAETPRGKVLLEIVMKMLHNDLPPRLIAQCTGLPLSVITVWAAEEINKSDSSS